MPFLSQGWPHRTPPNGLFALNRASPQMRGLASWWPSNGQPNGAGVVMDRAGSNHGTRSGSVTTLPLGEFGTVLDFPGGGSDYITLANQDFDQITVTAWIWSSSSNEAGFNHIISRHPDWFLSHGGGSGIRFNINGIAEAYAASGYTGVSNQWCHLAATYDKVNITGYLNGIQTGSPTAYSNPIGSSGTQRMGAYGGGGFNWVGRMADVRIYNRALTAAEIWQIYAPQTRWQLYQPWPLPMTSIVPASRAYYLPLLGAG